jgi:hypothetical protein
MGLTHRETVALMGGGHSLGMMHPARTGFTGSWTTTPTKLNNEYFTNLMDERWEEHKAAGSLIQYKAEGKDLYILKPDLSVRVDPELQVNAHTRTHTCGSPPGLFATDVGCCWHAIEGVSFARFVPCFGGVWLTGHLSRALTLTSTMHL